MGEDNSQQLRELQRRYTASQVYLNMRARWRQSFICAMEAVRCAVDGCTGFVVGCDIEGTTLTGEYKCADHIHPQTGNLFDDAPEAA